MDVRTLILGLMIAGVLVLLAPIAMLFEPWYSSELRSIEAEILSLDHVQKVDVRGNRDVTLEDISATIWLDNGNVLSFVLVTRDIVRIGNKGNSSNRLLLSRIGPWKFDVQKSGYRGVHRISDGEPVTSRAKCRFINIANCKDATPGLAFDVSSIEEVIQRYDEILESVDRLARQGESIKFEIGSGVHCTVRIVRASKVN